MKWNWRPLSLKSCHFEASKDVMTKIKSRALHIIRIKSWKASGSVNPPSLIPALRKIAILGLKTSFSILFLHSNRWFHIFENIIHLQKFNNYIKPKSHLATLDHAISYSNQDQQTTWEESRIVVLLRSVVFGILILMSVSAVMKRRRRILLPSCFCNLLCVRGTVCPSLYYQ